MSTTINFRLDEDVKEKLISISEEKGIKISFLLRIIVEDYLLERAYISSKNNIKNGISDDDDDDEFSFNVELVYE